MDPRSFDDIARSLAAPRRLATRRGLLAAIPALVATAAAPRLSRAFDAGEVGPVTTAGGAIICSRGADCPAGLICLNNICSYPPVGGARLDAPPLVEQPMPTPARPAVISGQPAASGQPDSGATEPSPRPNPTPAASATPEGGIGGMVGSDPLPAGIFKGRCGKLGAEAEFPLIDVGSEQRPSGDAPAGAPEDPTDFSATVVNSSLDDLRATDHAIDIRIDPRDPKTSVACGNIEGQIDETGAKRELPVALAEQNGSGVDGLAWIRDEGERALSYVYADRPEGAREQDGKITPTYLEGDTVRPIADLNLRGEPSIDAPIVGILPAGADLEVTNDSADGWIPVKEPISGARGFVSEEFVEAVD
ncbi:MAG: SH3 domain-containing protein [Chloroflexota bacterium]